MHQPTEAMMGRHTDTPEAADDAWTENGGDQRPDDMFEDMPLQEGVKP